MEIAIFIVLFFGIMSLLTLIPKSKRKKELFDFRSSLTTENLNVAVRIFEYEGSKVFGVVLNKSKKSTHIKDIYLEIQKNGVFKKVEISEMTFDKNKGLDLTVNKEEKILIYLDIFYLMFGKPLKQKNLFRVVIHDDLSTIYYSEIINMTKNKLFELSENP